MCLASTPLSARCTAAECRCREMLSGSCSPPLSAGLSLNPHLRGRKPRIAHFEVHEFFAEMRFKSRCQSQNLTYCGRSDVRYVHRFHFGLQGFRRNRFHGLGVRGWFVPVAWCVRRLFPHRLGLFAAGPESVDVVLDNTVTFCGEYRRYSLFDAVGRKVYE